jgi:uncharacterized cupredoxin-like copper-binding protein
MRRLPALLLLATAAMSGCGGSGSPVEAPDRTLRITVDEYRLRPQEIEIPAGRGVRLVVRNEGRLTHNVAVESWNPPPGVQPYRYGRSDTAQPGETVHEQRPFRLKPGRYRLACLIANHDSLGMWGELRVVKRKR